MWTILGSLLSILPFCVTLVSRRSYDGHHIINVTPSTANERNALAAFLEHQNVDIWSFPHSHGSQVTFVASGDTTDVITSWLVDNGMDYDVREHGVQRLIEEETESLREEAESYMHITGGRVDFNLGVYHDHTEMNQFLVDITAECDICQTINIGQSYEGRDMVVFKMGQIGSGKSGVWIDAGIHAREWVAPAAALFIIEKLVDGYRNNDTEVMSLLDSYVWYILPCANPDGYMYSRESDRMWRKTRKPIPGNDCVGTDPNRNWGFHWNEVGSSEDPCSQIYAGPKEFSEPETRAMSNFLLKLRGRLSMYLSFHAYGQYWLSPWGYDTELPEDHAHLMRVGTAGVNKIYEVSRRRYTLGPIASVMYPSAGSSADWAKAVARIKYSYGAELRDTGEYGFLLPARQIRASAREIWMAVMAMANEVLLIEINE